MAKDKRFVFRQDEDSHWYLIPERESAGFAKLCEAAYKNDDFDIFEDAYGALRCDSPFNYSFTDPKPGASQ